MIIIDRNVVCRVAALPIIVLLLSTFQPKRDNNNSNNNNKGKDAYRGHWIVTGTHETQADNKIVC